MEFRTMKGTMMKKKEYIQPLSELIEIGVLNVLALSKDDEQMDSDDQMSKENDRIGGGWDNIWGNM